MSVRDSCYTARFLRCSARFFLVGDSEALVSLLTEGGSTVPECVYSGESRVGFHLCQDENY